jgi:hypothetical protein
MTLRKNVCFNFNEIRINHFDGMGHRAAVPSRANINALIGAANENRVADTHNATI